MPKKRTPIPVNHFVEDLTTGISIEKIDFKDLPTVEGLEQAERHNCHSFFLVESGTVSLEIDFQKFKIKPSTIIYMHPNQVHRITAFKNVIVSCWAIHDENLDPGYLKLLQEITPAKPLALKKETVSIISEAISLCIKISERKKDKLYHALLKDSCNVLVALVLSHYIEQSTPADKLSRFETVTKAFNKMLERHYTTSKSPAEYSKKLHISAAYLNECVKHTTGHPVSYHIQQRIILEAKRLLHHSGQSVKEIAIELGYDDYHYFSRLFAKVAAMPPLAFRNKNLD
jgi:AraC-like DNA-binding protein